MNPQVLDKRISESNQCFTLYDVRWEKFEAIEAALEDIPDLVIYDAVVEFRNALRELKPET